jgi:two-component system sensor histidine kinase/response regulator
MKLKHSLILLWLFFSMASARPLFAQESPETITVMLGETNTPFSFQLPNGQAAGLYVDFWELWSATNNIPVNIVLAPLEDGLRAVKDQQAVLGGVFVNDERDAWGDFSVAFHSVQTGILYNRSSSKAEHQLLSGAAKVAVLRASFQSTYLQEQYPEMELSLYDNLEPVMFQLLAGEIDAIVAEIPALNSELSKLSLNGLLAIADSELLDNTVHVLVAEEQAELLATINQGIMNIPVGSLVAQEKKWLPSLEPFFRNTSSVPNLSLAEQQWLQRHHSFQVGVDNSWYPFDFRDKNGRYSGVAASYINYLSDTLGISIKPVVTESWNEAFDEFKAGNIDIMAAAIMTTKRISAADFTDPYFMTPTAIVIRSDGFYAGSMEELAGRKLGLVRGFAIVDFVVDDYPKIDVQLVDTIVEGLEKLQSGEIDAYVGALAVVNYEIASRDLPDLVVAGFTPYKFEISMAVRKQLSPLTSILNKTFASMDEREKARIANDWLSVHLQSGTDLSTILRWGLPILALLLLVIVSIVLFNRRLQREITSRILAEEELKHLAQHDVLTGLPNRRLFDELSHAALLRARRSKTSQALLFLDLDGFKQVNDTLGHNAGDSLLVDIAQRFKGCIRDSDLIARIGGDEFVIHLATDCNDHDAVLIAKKVLNSMAVPFQLDDATATVGASIGISMYPADGDEVAELLQKADSAMYAAKLAGKNSYKLFSECSNRV